LQGTADRLVPLSTARELGSAAPDRGWDVGYVEFPGPVTSKCGTSIRPGYDTAVFGSLGDYR
jgi:hypothetical protein